ncbi:hypothetical protein Pcinc_037770 [Petrolisthes cinctipes]|uniref:Uncharacterized protein n=1 Tax=Petrolisthes cinctipes TaxID=88211 RepID=A0AAE1BRS2_PETCI|nr:hypothetical protein Pcinc_037770 [Petrolisthes cinctipes]
MKRVTNQLEQTVLSQLEGIEESITESFLTQRAGRQAMKYKTQIEEGWVGEQMMMIKSPTAREQHNQKILDILNTGDLQTLHQKLVTVGPKTAIMIHQCREFNGRFEC